MAGFGNNWNVEDIAEPSKNKLQGDGSRDKAEQRGNSKEDEGQPHQLDEERSRKVEAEDEEADDCDVAEMGGFAEVEKSIRNERIGAKQKEKREGKRTKGNRGKRVIQQRKRDGYWERGAGYYTICPRKNSRKKRRDSVRPSLEILEQRLPEGKELGSETVRSSSMRSGRLESRIKVRQVKNVIRR